MDFLFMITAFMCCLPFSVKTTCFSLLSFYDWALYA